MSVRKLSTTTWSFTNSGFGIIFQHNKLKHQAPSLHDLIVGISTVQPVQLAINKQDYWLYRNEVYTTSSEFDTDKSSNIVKTQTRIAE